MKLWQTRRHWEKFARTDPLWAVLAAPDKDGNRWTVDDFFAAGEREVEAALDIVHRRFPQLPRRRALDFGCGVGRLTQALAGHFDRVTGVDISTEMIAHARRHNRHGDRVAYVHNPAADLACFADGTFDLVLSFITLQHVAPAFAWRYLAEFLRVCAPGGAVYFQVTDHEINPKPARRSFYPPTVAKKLWRRLNDLLALRPVMEMHVLPRREVEAAILAAGGELLLVDEGHGLGQDYASYVYLVHKP